MNMELKRNWIAGQWVEGAGSRVTENPSDKADPVGTYASASAAQVNDAVAAAKKAFTAWSRTSPQVRADILDKIGTEILARKDELGRQLSREEGKTLAEGVGEATRAGQVWKWFAGEALRIHGDKMAGLRPGTDVEVIREPVGVIGIITPWNFPIAIPSWKAAPALAFGNCVVLKPADLVPASSWSIADIVSRAGVPEGVFNLVMGSGSVVGNAIINHKDVSAVTFTGSTKTGRSVAEACVKRLARVQLEMGGKNPMVVLDDADLDIAVEASFNGAFVSTGQRCTASSRLIVQQGIHDKFIAAMIERVKKTKIDNALEAGTEIGPVVDQRQLDQDLSYIDIAQKEGAKLAWGGELLNRKTQGFYLNCALITETKNDMRINREEVFGPVASVIRVKDYDEALAVANDTEYGLVGGICTTSLKHASHFKRNIETGMCMVNLPTAGVDYNVPFGGRKNSSFGPREQGELAREFFTLVKTAYVRA
jgi:alpha-ketoglutaric semialdehyde dehydrogenase